MLDILTFLCYNTYRNQGTTGAVSDKPWRKKGMDFIFAIFMGGVLLALLCLPVGASLLKSGKKELGVNVGFMGPAVIAIVLVILFLVGPPVLLAFTPCDSPKTEDGAVCPNCSISVTSEYCSDCGHCMTETKPACLSCGAEWDATYCGDCGAKIDQK